MKDHGGRSLLVVAAVWLLLGAVACGGGDDGTPAADPATAPDSSPTDPDQDSTKGAGRATTKCTKEDRAKTVVDVKIVDFSFKPRDLRLPAGEKVTVAVTNTDDVRHDLTIYEVGCTTSSVTSKKVFITFKMPNKPTEFLCAIHPNVIAMHGRLLPKDG